MAARELINRDDNGSHTFCARPVSDDEGSVLYIGITTHTLLKILAGVFLLLTLLNSTFQISRHLRTYTVPRQQRQIICVIFVPTVFAIFSFLSVMFYEVSIYLHPVAEIYESIAIPAIFILYVQYVCPESSSWWGFFDQLEVQDERGNLPLGGSLVWFKRTWILVFQ